MTVHLSLCGRGRIASKDAIRVRGLSPRVAAFCVRGQNSSSVADFVRCHLLPQRNLRLMSMCFFAIRTVDFNGRLPAP